MKAYDYIPRYTYDDYAQWQGDWELINGYPHAMSPSPVRKHQIVYTELAVEVYNALKNERTCDDCKVFQDLDWVIDEQTVVRPDLMIVCGKFTDDFLKRPPVLAVEILSKSTSLKDRHIKYQLYETQGVRYYILVNPDTKTTEVFELVNGQYVPNNSLTEYSFNSTCKLAFNIPAYVQQLNLD
ncbi:MAG TPA: Uma2 family endonuclease [Chitinophagales bacterium]|nr:Uma2 family endonuclease [Chitinophagales bacterium]